MAKASESRAKKSSEKKASPPRPPVSLGTKRVCPKCSTKFYDFQKATPTCPKCETVIDMSSTEPIKPPPAPRRPIRAADKEAAAEKLLAGEEVAPATGEDAVESLEDLADDGAEEIDVSDDDSDDEDY